MTPIRPRLQVDYVRAVTWGERAACRNSRVDFFGPDSEGASVKRIEQIAAVFCHASGCPVIDQCREHALTKPERYGVWGGLTSDERAAILKRERRRRSA